MPDRCTLATDGYQGVASGFKPVTPPIWSANPRTPARVGFSPALRHRGRSCFAFRECRTKLG
jgi:hypothetical protein